MPTSFGDELAEFGLRSGTDKTLVHHYERVYGRILERFRADPNFAMLEVGFGSGAGIEFWKAAFPNAYIYCFDRDHQEEGDRFRVLRVDQSDATSLQAGMQLIDHPVSLIVDDGSHHPSHQLLTFSSLFGSLLMAGGTYVIEDVETSYWRLGSLYDYTFNYGLSDPWSAMEAFKIVCDYVNRRFLSLEDRSFLQYRMMSVGLDPSSAEEIESIQFAQNLIVLNKHESPLPCDEPYINAKSSKRF